MSQAFGLDDAGRRYRSPAPEGEVDLDQKTPAELRRLWSIRQKWSSTKGRGMWNNIIRDYLGPEEADALSKDKKIQVKAKLQMRIHRGVLRHGAWPAREKAALLRAYLRWKKNRYHEISRLLMEELHNEGYAPAYKWKSVHVEAELVKDGLEQRLRETSNAHRTRVQVPARHHAAESGSPHTIIFNIRHPTSQSQQQQQAAVYGQMPGFDDCHSQYYWQQPHQPYDVGGGHKRQMPGGSLPYDMLVEPLTAQPQLLLADEQHDQLIDEHLKRTPLGTGPEDPAMAALERYNDQHQHQYDDLKMFDDPSFEEQFLRSRSPSTSLLHVNNGIAAAASASQHSSRSPARPWLSRRAASC
ncbi:hypothetical protein J7T55_001264 [Diaporthe amygdali]|uniref:uncharacterized protein n=1 Tax=Phomopsis amygdali TaxID=1214568 RepID=UPI0022FE9D17|nr:uncharacterized protein J7T55_001264 [Diaporthe amygdali]KAJ0100680.1 hypothetical protein J7T55_001264 [Diaporthe amygdali]